MYQPGTRVRLKVDHSKIGIIASVVAYEPVVSYLVFHDSSDTETYYEDQIEQAETEKNSDMLSAEQFISLYLSHKMRLNPKSSLFSLNAGRIKFIPFQFRPLIRILKAERPRILIADEVGVGKTIETGIILKEFEKRDSMNSAMIICPKDLTSKWRSEMKNRFDEAFEILSSDRLRYCMNELELEGVWPLECRKCIVSLELIRREDIIERLYSIEDPAVFDVLVVDEAHHVINPNGNSHAVTEYFCDNSETAVFLSATPLQLGSGDLFSLLNLLLPEEFMDINVFRDMAAPNSFINAAIRNIRNAADPEWNQKAAENLENIMVNEWAEKTFSGNHLLNYWTERLSSGEKISDEERITCLRDIESLHTFSHVINRTKRKDIGEFTIREPITVKTYYNDEERAFYNAARSFRYSSLEEKYGSRTANLIMSTIERQITSSLHAFVQMLDQFIDRGIFYYEDYTDDIDEETSEIKDADFYNMAGKLRKLADTLPETDQKTDKLLDIINDTVNNTESGKLLVFSFFRNTLRYLSEKIREAGYRVEVITGQTPNEAREDFRQRFRMEKQNENALDVLLCSEVGCEGLDYEFCSRMVNFDIPWNPMKIEQRIGRIDRFGQKSPKVQIYNFITDNTVEEKIFYRCFDRLGIFNETIGDLEGVLGDVVSELTSAAFDMNLSDEQRSARTQQIIDNRIRLADEQRHFEKESKNLFLMDIDEDDSEIASSRNNQIKLQMIIIKEFLKKQYPETTISDLQDHRFKIRMHKKDKQEILKQLNQMKKKRKADKNNRQVRKFEEYLVSDIQSVAVCFDGEDVGNDEMICISATHPLMIMAVDCLNKDNEVFYTSLKTASSDTLAKGKYLFGCYDWKERGYRKSDDIRVLLFDLEKSTEKSLSVEMFERIVLGSERGGEISEPDLSKLNRFVYDEQQAARERLKSINEDIVTKKISTINRYFSGQIDRYSSLKLSAKEPKIYRMYDSRIKKLEGTWEEKKNELEEKYGADIIVKPFASGIIEVV